MNIQYSCLCATDDDVINDVVQYDFCEYGEQVF